MTAQTQSPARKRAPELAYNQYGQKIGSKGERTRQLLIDTTVELLESHGLRDVSVVDVARAWFAFGYQRGLADAHAGAVRPLPDDRQRERATASQIIAGMVSIEGYFD